MSKRPLTEERGEVRELDSEDIRAMRPAEEVLPRDLLAVLPKRRPGQRGPGKSPPKQLVSLRLKPEVLAAYRAMGKGWQTRMADILERSAKRIKRGSRTGELTRTKRQSPSGSKTTG